MAVGPFPRPSKKTLSLVIAALIEAKQVASFKVVSFIVTQVGCKPGSALTRFYRLLHNQRIELLALSRQLLCALARAREPLVIALDWTEWHPPLHMLLASVIRGKRALPVFCAVFDKLRLPRSQNAQENTFLKLLVQNLNALSQTAIFLADRGFRRVSFLKLLLDQKGHHFIVRLMDHITIETATGQLLLEKIPLAPGQVLDLGWVKLRQDGFVTVRLIGIWAKGQREPWWLATNLSGRVARIASLYDRRMGIEEQIRDTKGCRFGIKLFWTQFQNPDHLARLTLILAFALLILTALGRAILRVIPSADLPHPTKGPRLSFISIALNYGLRPIGEAVLDIGWFRKNLPPPQLRKFDWIEGEKEHRKK
jgi:hypothetical protein